MLALLDGLDWRTARVARRRRRQRLLLAGARRACCAPAALEPGAHLAACDVVPEAFRYAPVRCASIAADGRLPFADAEFDAVVSIEVVEHVENQFAFLRELARIAKPGAPSSWSPRRTRSTPTRGCARLLQGFPLLFDPLPLGRTATSAI